MSGDRERGLPVVSTGLADSGTPSAGALLVATPVIDEPVFRRTVILMLEHSEEGSLGVVLNDASDLQVADLLPEWGQVLEPTIAVGGPVQTDAGVAVARVRTHALDRTPGGLRLVGANWAVLDLDGAPEGVESAVSTARLFLGYAGWGPGQLGDELAEGSWWVLPALPTDLRSLDAGGREALWRTVLARQANELRFASTYPDRPELN